MRPRWCGACEIEGRRLMGFLKTAIDVAVSEAIAEHPKYFTPKGVEHAKTAIVRKVMAALRDGGEKSRPRNQQPSKPQRSPSSKVTAVKRKVTPTCGWSPAPMFRKIWVMAALQSFRLQTATQSTPSLICRNASNGVLLLTSGSTPGANSSAKCFRKPRAA